MLLLAYNWYYCIHLASLLSPSNYCYDSTLQVRGASQSLIGTKLRLSSNYCLIWITTVVFSFISSSFLLFIALLRNGNIPAGWGSLLSPPRCRLKYLPRARWLLQLATLSCRLSHSHVCNCLMLLIFCLTPLTCTMSLTWQCHMKLV